MEKGKKEKIEVKVQNTITPSWDPHFNFRAEFAGVRILTRKRGDRDWRVLNFLGRLVNVQKAVPIIRRFLAENWSLTDDLLEEKLLEELWDFFREGRKILS